MALTNPNEGLREAIFLPDSRDVIFATVFRRVWKQADIETSRNGKKPKWKQVDIETDLHKKSLYWSYVYEQHN